MHLVLQIKANNSELDIKNFNKAYSFVILLVVIQENRCNERIQFLFLLDNRYIRNVNYNL